MVQTMSQGMPVLSREEMLLIFEKIDLLNLENRLLQLAVQEGLP